VNDGLRPPRRRILAALAGAPLLGTALTGCTTPSRGKLAARRDEPNADARVRWNAARTEQGLLVLHAATIARHRELADAVEAFSAHHLQHLDALLSDGPLPLLARLDLDTPLDALADIDLDSVDAPDVPRNADRALDAVREAELTASGAHLADCLRATGPRLAALLASIAAAEATHNAALGDA
jgi:hypothetical protein